MRLGSQRWRAGRQEDFRRGGAIDAASELAVDLSFCEIKHQTLIKGHRGMDKSVAGSPSDFAWIGKQAGARFLGGEENSLRQDPKLAETTTRARISRLRCEREPAGWIWELYKARLRAEGRNLDETGIGCPPWRSPGR